jgi:ATP-dependent DNA helicase PIF1
MLRTNNLVVKLLSSVETSDRLFLSFKTQQGKKKLKAYIVNSYLWKNCIVLQLTENMRLDSRDLSAADKEELRTFAEWLLRVGNGVEAFVQFGTDRGKKYIRIPESLLLPQQHRNLDGLISFVYSHGCEPEHHSSYFSNRSILCPKK